MKKFEVTEKLNEHKQRELVRSLEKIKSKHILALNAFEPVTTPTVAEEVKAGKLQMRTLKDVLEIIGDRQPGRYMDLEDFFIGVKECERAADLARSKRETEVQAKIAKVNEMADHIRMTAVFGSGSEAMRILQEFMALDLNSL